MYSIWAVNTMNSSTISYFFGILSISLIILHLVISLALSFIKSKYSLNFYKDAAEGKACYYLKSNKCINMFFKNNLKKNDCPRVTCKGFKIEGIIIPLPPWFIIIDKVNNLIPVISTAILGLAQIK
jgi:hypothetical protein